MRKTIAAAAAAALILGAGAAPARADDSDGWHLAAALDVLTPGNASKHRLNAAKAACAAQVAGGAASCAGTASTAAALGARVGAYRQWGGAYAGPTASFLYGGPSAGKTTMTEVPAGTLSQKTTEDSGRFLLEFGRMIPLGEVWVLGLGAGMGAAVVLQKRTCVETGSLSGACAAPGFAPGTSKMGWATWELSPAVMYKSLEFGFRYVGFGRKKQAAWGAFGVFFGGRF